MDEGKKELVKKIKEKMHDPNLLVDTVKEVQKEVAGEEDTIIAETIVASTRLVENAIHGDATALRTSPMVYGYQQY